MAAQVTVVDAPPSRLRFPQLAVGPDADSIIVGIDGLIFRRRDRTPLPRGSLSLRVFHVGRHAFEAARLSGDFVFAYPRAANGRDGVLHVIWAEPDSADRPKYTPLHLAGTNLTTLWHATFRDGTWSQPHVIYHGLALTWEPAYTSGLVAESSGDPAMVFATVPAPNRASVITYLRLRDSTASTQELTPTDTPESYTDFATLGHLTVIAYVAPDPVNVLFVIRSTDDGRTWSKPIAISKVTQGLAHYPRLVIDSAHTFHIVWMASGPDLAASGLLHATSRDGEHWIADTSGVLSGFITQLYAVADRCGSITVISAPLSGNVHLSYQRLGSHSATKIRPLFPDWVQTHSPSAINDGTHIRFAWDGWRNGDIAETAVGAIVPIQTVYGDVNLCNPR